MIIGDVRYDRVAAPPWRGHALGRRPRGRTRGRTCEHARRPRGARSSTEPTDHVYGERQYSAEDPWGHRWTFSQTLADVDPADWGGILRE